MSTAKRTINVNLESYTRFQEIHKSRAQDRTYAETFDHIIGVYQYQTVVKP